jgi:tol-pal system protein YbgF
MSSHKSFRAVLLATVLGFSVAAVGAASAQTADDRRFDRIERQLKSLQQMVLQAQATGQPVLVRPEGPDPALIAMQQRLDDMEQTLTRLNGGIENALHDLDTLRRNTAQDNTARGLELRSLSDRIAKLEALASAAQGPLLGDAAGTAPPPPPPPASRDSAATARAQAADTGVLGANPFAPPPPPTPAQAFQSARAALASGDPAGAASGFQDFITRYPDDARTPEAYYWLGESFYQRKGYTNATAAYASALRSNPKTAWGSAAMVRLAQSLNASGQPSQACAALNEYSRNYATRATAAVKSDAAALKNRLKCG